MAAVAEPPPPPPALVRQAIATLRHVHWYRDDYEGGCPTSCKALFSWDSLPVSLRASVASIQAQLTKKKEICPEEQSSDQGEEESSLNASSSTRTLAARLCDLHRSQASWKKWGTTCKGEYCDGHEWPNERDAPLLYVRSTSPRQAVILLHFGLLKEAHVDRLVRDNFPVALFIAHLLHNSGVPDKKAFDLLEELSRSTSTCLTRIWEEEGEEGDGSGDEENEGEEEEDEDPDQDVENAAEEEEEDKNLSDQRTSPKASPRRTPRKSLQTSPVFSKTPKTYAKRRSSGGTSSARKVARRLDVELEEKRDASEEEQESSPSSKREESESASKKAPPKRVADVKPSAASPKKRAVEVASDEEEEGDEKDSKEENKDEEEENKDEDHEEVDEKDREEDDKENPSKEEVDDDDEQPRALGAGDSEYVPYFIGLKDSAGDAEKLLSSIMWQDVYYRGKRLDRKKAVFSLFETDFTDFDGVSPTIGEFPAIIEKYRKLCETKHKEKLNHCVATLFPKATNSILPKEEEIEHLEKQSSVYYLTFGSDCPFEIQNSMLTEDVLMRPRSVLVLGSTTLRKAKYGFPARAHGSGTLNKPRIVLAFRCVLPSEGKK